MASPEKNYRRVFEAHGIEFIKDSGDGKNWICDCPFSGKEQKLYVNVETGQWDSKVAGISGNHFTFLREFYRWALENTKGADLSELAQSRMLPLSAFIGKVARNPLNGKYLIPEYNAEGKLTGIGSWFPGSKGVFRTPMTNVQLNGAHQIKEGETLFICEGEWDYFALQWLFDFLGKENCRALCLPGAGTFKDDWQPFFKNHSVRCCYDNDEPGRKGEAKAKKLLLPVAFDLKFAHWNVSLKDGYDIRDLITETCKGKEMEGVAKKAYMKLMAQFDIRTNQEFRDGEDGGPEKDKAPEDDGSPIPTPEELEKGYSKWLKMASYVPLDVIFGTIFANRIDGDPVWTFIIAPPSGSKTELLMTLNGSPEIETTTTLTAPALISGIKFPEGNDPSLLVKVNKRMLVIKDFTTILTMNTNARDEVFGILRDVYDGYVEKFFGTGVKKSYHSKFGILAGVTPAIDAVSAQHSALGERFLKFRLDRYETHDGEKAKIKRALSNVGQETEMRKELQALAKRMLKKQLPKELPKLPPEMLDQVTAIAMFTANLRGAVMKDPYSGEMLCLPVREVGTRLAKQMVKLGVGISVFRDKDVIDEEVLDILRLVSLDTAPDRVNALMKFLWAQTKDDPKKFVSTKDIAEFIRMSDATISRVVQDCLVLGLLHKQKDGGPFGGGNKYRLSASLEELVITSKIYG